MKLKRAVVMIIFIVLDILLLLSFLIYKNDNGIPFSIISGNFFILFGLFLLILSLIILIFSIIKPSSFEKYKNVFFEDDKDDEFYVEKYIEELRTKIIDSYGNKKEENQIDIIELMLGNMKEIKDYYVISKKQAKNSFSLAVWMCIIGFCFIIISIVLTIIFNKSIVLTLIPAIEGVISEIIAGTALVVYKTSLEQLNNYYESLHNNERFLSLVNIVNKVSKDKQDDVYINIIDTELKNYRKKTK